MIKAEDFCCALKDLGYNFFTGVPCNFFKHAINFTVDDKDIEYIAAPNEGCAAAIAAGAYLGGKKAAVMMQNSGIGNLINPITSLNMIYDIPTLLLVSGRGYKIDNDEPQHAIMGARMRDIFDSIGVINYELPENLEEFKGVLAKINHEIYNDKKVAALIVKKGSIGEYDLKTVPTGKNETRSISKEQSSSPLMARYDAIELIASCLGGDEAVIASTGKISRELFVINDKPANFYMQGSLGHASAIGLGLALSRPEKKVVVLEGDGAIIMHMGMLSTVGHYKPKNMAHIVLDNETYDSTGGQFTTSTTTLLEDVAGACGYSASFKVITKDGLKNALKSALSTEGPTFIIVKVCRDKREVPRITTKYTCSEITNNFRRFLNSDK